MGKYTVKFSCGHEEEIELFGKVKERYKRIEWLEQNGVCSKCYKEMKNIENSIGCEEVEMPYREYKEKYPDCKTKNGSWNPQTKTIVVYVPVKEDEE